MLGRLYQGRYSVGAGLPNQVQRMMNDEERIGQAAELPAIEEVLCDPAVSFWLEEVLRAALSRDPVDAANDAEVLAKLLDRKCREMLSGS